MFQNIPHEHQRFFSPGCSNDTDFFTAVANGYHEPAKNYVDVYYNPRKYMKLDVGAVAKNLSIGTTENAFKLASKYGHLSIVKLLEERYEFLPDVIADAFYYSAVNKCWDVYQFLDKSFPEVRCDYKDIFLKSVALGNFDNAKEMIEHKNIDILYNDYGTLNLAVMNGHDNLVKFLFREGLHSQSRFDTALEWAVRCQRISTAALLLDLGAHVTDALFNKNNMLEICSWSNCKIEMFELFLCYYYQTTDRVEYRKGVAKLLENYCRSCLKNGNLQMIDLIVCRKKQVRLPFTIELSFLVDCLCTNGSDDISEIFRYIQSNYDSITSSIGNVVDALYSTPLVNEQCIQNFCLELDRLDEIEKIEYPDAFRLKINEVPRKIIYPICFDKNRALLISIRHNYYQAVKFLIRDGARTNALNLLSVASEVGNLNMVKLLISRGAGLDENGSSPICYALVKNNFAVLLYLLERMASDTIFFSDQNLAIGGRCWDNLDKFLDYLRTNESPQTYQKYWARYHRMTNKFLN